MKLADYYPKEDRLVFMSSTDGMPSGGIIGDIAHLKAARLMASGSAIVRICLDSRMNRHRRNRMKCPYEGLSIKEVSNI